MSLPLNHTELANVFFPRSFFILPVVHFPWSVKAMQDKGKLDTNGSKIA